MRVCYVRVCVRLSAAVLVLVPVLGGLTAKAEIPAFSHAGNPAPGFETS